MPREMFMERKQESNEQESEWVRIELQHLNEGMNGTIRNQPSTLGSWEFINWQSGNVGQPGIITGESGRGNATPTTIHESQQYHIIN